MRRILIAVFVFALSFESRGTLVGAETSADSIKAAIKRSLPLLQNSAATYIAKRKCFTCHHQALPAMTIALAGQKKLKVDTHAARSQSKFTHKYFTGRRDQLRQGNGVPGGAYTAGYALVSLAADRWEADETTADLVKYLMKKQQDNGRWRIHTHRAPLEDSDFTATALSLRGLQLFGSQQEAQDIAQRIDRARKWLLTATPKTNEDAVFRLFGLKWSEADEDEVRKTAEALKRQQRDDGGWAQLSDMPSDAYATGQALVALHQAGGVAVNDAGYRRGVTFLLQKQLGDGSWLVQTRSRAIQTYFESGFPHKKSQFISICGTSWSTMALMLALPVDGTSGKR